MTIDKFIEEIISNYDDSPIDLTHEVIKQELLKLLDTRKTVSIEAVLLQKKNTNQKKFYKFLVHYFDKTYLKKKLDIITKLNDQAILESKERDIAKEIEKIDRGDKKLRKIQSYLEQNLYLNTKEIERLDRVGQDISKTIEQNEIKDFEEIKDLYANLLEEAKKDSKQGKQDIKEYKDQITELKSKSKTVDLSDESFDSIKPKILKNKLKIGLHTKNNQHRDCIDGINGSCDFFLKVVTLIDNTLEKLKEISSEKLKRSKAQQEELIKQLNIKGGHSEKHENAFKRIIEYVAEECGQEREKAQIKHQNKITELEWTIAKINAQKDASDQILIPKLTKRITEIDNFFVFRKDLSFANKNSNEEDTSQKELTEYKEEKFKALFECQVGYLITTFKRVNDAYQDKVKKETPVIIKCIYEVFKEYYDDLNSNDSLIPQLILKLEQEINKKNHESKIKDLIKKKTTLTGGIEYILKKISWIFQQNKQDYDEPLDPEKIYYQILLEESQKKEKIEEASLERLQQELSVLEAQKKELSMQDNSLLREELENIDSCIWYIKNAKEVIILKNRIEDIEDSKSNKDDYYSFDIDKRRVCVRLLKTDPIEKSAEIKNIDRIRNYVTEQKDKLLEQKVLREKYGKELEEEKAKGFKGSFIEIQRKLLVKGISLCGYDTFENGEPLDELNSFISVIISTLIREDSLYQIDNINEVNKKIEGWTRKIRLQYNEFVLSKEVIVNSGEFGARSDGATPISNRRATSDDVTNFSSIDYTKQDEIEFIIKAVNEEFKSDNLFINQINIIKNKQDKEVFFSIRQPPDSPYRRNMIITLLRHKTQYLALVIRDKVKIYKDDRQIDVSIKIANILAVLQTEEDLFKYVCRRRLQEILEVTLEYSKKLVEGYKREKGNLAKISSLKDFNALFCNMLELTDTADSQSFSLFAYLAYLEKLDNGIENDDPQEKIARLKIVKNLYDKALFRIIKAEQQRRQKDNVTQLQELREELYLKELIKDRQEELELLSQEIRNNEENIEKDQGLINSLLLKKEGAKDKYEETIEQLSNIVVGLKEKLQFAQEGIRELSNNEKENQQQIKELQKEIVRLEGELKKIEDEIKLKEEEKEALEIQIGQLENRRKELHNDLRRVNAEKERKEQEEAEKQKEIDVSNDIVKLIQNLKSILANSKLQSKKEEIKKSIYENSNLKTLLEKLRKELEKLLAENTINFWQLLVRDINYEQLKQYIDSDKKIAGSLSYELVNRLRAVIRDAVSIECEIVQELIKDKPIKKFKVLATNVNYKDIHDKIKGYVEKAINCAESTKGLSFSGDFLHSTEYGITAIKDIHNELRTLIERRIELHYKSEEVESKKNAKFADAAKVINDLKIDYKDVVSCYVDEIEIIASGNFILSDSPSYPGIDVTVNAVNMECIGKNLTLDTSGKDGTKFCHKASDGRVKRSNDNQPRGDKGYDGYDGDHGNHGGNIVIRIENTIKNLESLKSIKVNGGNGAEGQLGGNGDEGLKGKDGKDGQAEDTKGLGVGHTNIGFGSRGTAGGCGGSPGKTGRPGMGGKAGVIDIQHKAGKITIGEMNQGYDADNILDKSKPSGGQGGEPGLYGMDQVKDKDNFFVKTKTFYTVIDRADLIEKYPEFRDQIRAAENVTSTNDGVFTVLSIAAAFAALPVTLLLALTSFQVLYKEADNPIEYRDREHQNKRGQNNEEEAQLRDDYRTLQQNKRDVINIDSLHSKLSEKKIDEKEVSWITLYRENIYDLVVEQEKLVGDIEIYTQETSNIQYDMGNVEIEIETKRLKLDKVLGDIESLQNKDSSLSSKKIGKINQIITAITTAQNLRDKKGVLELDTIQTLAKSEKYSALREELYGNKQYLIRILDEYLETVRDRLKSNRRNLKYLNKDFASKQLDIRDLSKKLVYLQQERLSQIVTETEIDEEIEKEAETQHVEEIMHVIGWKDREIYLKAKYNNKKQINENSYITTENLFDLQNIPVNIAEIKFILDQSVKHYRAGVINYEKVKLIITELNKKNEQVSFTKNDFKEIVESYTKEIKRIRIDNNISTLSSIKRNLLLDYLKQISTRLKIDHLAHLSDDMTGQVFVLQMMKVIELSETQEDNIAQKLQVRFEGQSLLVNDRLKDDIDYLIDLIEDRKTFYLEKCAINFTQKFTPQTVYEKTMLTYNKQPNLKNLESVVSEFKMHQVQVLSQKKEEQFSKEYLQSVEGFISTIVENIRYHGTSVLNNIIKNNSSKKSTKHQEEYFQLIEVINNDITTIYNSLINKVSPSLKSISLTQVIEKIIKIIRLFNTAVKVLRDGARSKKEGNRVIKSLEVVTKKLIKYIDYPNNSCQEIEVLVNSYLELLSELTLDIESTEDINEKLEGTEERIISKTYDEVITDTSSKQIVEIKQNQTSSNSGLQGVGLRQTINISSINWYFSEYTLSAIEDILELRVNDLGLSNVSIARNSVFQEHYNNLQKMIDDLIDTKSSIVLAPMNLYNKHAVGIMGLKNQDNELRLYYIDPSNAAIPDKLKQIFIENGLQIEQLPAEQQKYGNCGPEVIENFMLYLAAERLSQEESINYHSGLLERQLVSKANNLIEVMDDHRNDQESVNDLYEIDAQEKIQLESEDVEERTDSSCSIESPVAISTIIEDTKLFKKDKSLNSNNNPIDDLAREQEAFTAYNQGNILSNEAWEAESDENDDRSVEAEQKFAKSLQLYKEAVKLSPTNITYRHALDTTIFKIEGNSLFSEGVELANISYELQEGANELAIDQDTYQKVLRHYQQSLEFYQAAQTSFHQGWYLSKDVRFKSCIEIVENSIGLTKGVIEEIRSQVDGELIQEPNDFTEADNYLVNAPIELFMQDDQPDLLNNYLVGNIAQELYYM
ncbi:MAG: palindromic element RPE2 domain-containing protein (plasmid) [Rickettsia endosymbiont of Culicoides impunctatus]|nr:MAG: palindromic element RPE2 domain-containing protein [Rickettsia endosymbiont of Culicoides impunctatus]